MIILATLKGYYCATSSVIHQIIGHREKGRKLAGVERELRFDTARYMWTDEGLIDDVQRQAFQEMQEYRCTNIEDLYNEIMTRCTSMIMTPTLTAKKLRAMIPRPSLSELGVPLGTPLAPAPAPVEAPTDPIHESLNAPSRQNGRLDRGGRVGGSTAATGRRKERGKDSDDEVPNVRNKRCK